MQRSLPPAQSTIAVSMVAADQTRLSRIGGLSGGLAIAVIVLAPLPFGSTEPGWTSLWIALIAFSLLTTDSRNVSIPLARVLMVVFAAFTVYLGVGFARFLLPAGDPDAILTGASLLGIPAESVGGGRIGSAAFGMDNALLAVLVFFRIALLARRRAGARLALKAFAFSAAIYAAYGALELFADPGRHLWKDRVAYFGSLTGPFVNRNTAAAYFGAAAAVVGVLAASRMRAVDASGLSPRQWSALFLAGRERMVLAYLCLTLSLLAATAATGSRAGLLLGVGGLVFVAMSGREAAGGKRWAWTPVIILAAVLFALEAVGARGLLRLNALGLDGQGRLEVYAAALGLIWEYPLFGIGLGQFPLVFPAARPEGLTVAGVWDRAHSTPVELGVELGLPALAVIIGVWLWVGSAITRHAMSSFSSAAISGAAVFWLGTLHSLIDFPLQIPGYAVCFAAVVGAAAGQAFGAAPLDSGRGARAGPGGDVDAGAPHGTTSASFYPRL